MVRVSVIGDRVRFDVEGSHWLMAAKRRIEVPARAITGVRRRTEPLPFAAGIKFGTGLPGVIRAGSYWWNGTWTFWDVRYNRLDHVIQVDLAGTRYSTLLIEVEDPDATVRLIEAARPVAA